MEDQNFRELLRSPTKQEQRGIAIRPKTIPQEYREEWKAATIAAAWFREQFSERSETKSGYPPWMVLPPFLDRRLQELFGPSATWDFKLKKRIFKEFPEFRPTEKFWVPEKN